MLLLSAMIFLCLPLSSTASCQRACTLIVSVEAVPVAYCLPRLLQHQASAILLLALADVDSLDY
jgi:hypothetical protein